MLEATFDEIVPDELITAFRKMWAVEGPHAIAEVRKLIEVLAEGQNVDEVSAWVNRLALGLIGLGPDLTSWLEAVAVGGFELRPELDYAYSKDLKSRARYLARQQPMYGGDIEKHRQAWASEVTQMQAGGHLIAAAALLKEMRKNVAAKAAIGPGWALMVAVNDHCSANEKRMLHQFGGDNRLHELLAFAARWALKRFVTESCPNGIPQLSRAADWRRSLPPGVDVHAYFGKARQAKDQTSLGTGTLSHADGASVKMQILAGPRPSFLDFAALGATLKAAAAAKDGEDYDLFGPCIRPAEALVPPLSWLALYTISPEECFSRAMRAVARRRHRDRLAADNSPDTATEDYKVQVWLAHWINEGGGIPIALPMRYLSYVEEEACLAFETDGKQWRGYPAWSTYGLLPSAPSKLKPATLLDAQDMQPCEVVWVEPARRIDRILVGAQSEVKQEASE
jgi:hypothetical protein